MSTTYHRGHGRVVETFGRLDILVNSAGGAFYTPYKCEEIDEVSWDKVVDVNLKGIFLCCQVEQFNSLEGGVVVAKL